MAASASAWDGLASRLSSAAGRLGLPIDDVQVDKLLKYLMLLEQWNRVHSLSSWKSPSDLLVQHVFDGLTLVGPLRLYAAGTSLRILDAGSGPGFPAAVLALMQPSWFVTAVDAVAKKIAFVTQAAAELNVRNLIGRHGRLERLTSPEPVDVIVSRAFGSLEALTKQTRHLLAPAGVWVVQKGRRPDDEVAKLREDLEVFHVEPVTVPDLQAERCLVWMRRVVR
ncbi:MAG TPA: 16S rRNA (guanine(527)-N(7))-methyltransferase RsmG [Burkholderiaceae bacterium]|nr:16S rRNA (guanine(527)-N(7))-methyltransferase RsmG [Burkholderiaceae bacterium]